MGKRKSFNFLYVLTLSLLMLIRMQESAYAAQTGTIREMSARVYEKMSEESAVMGNVIKENVFTILAEETDADGVEWYLVQTDLGIKGYIKKEYVENGAATEENEQPKKWKMEFSQNVNIRLQPTTESEIVGRVPQYTILEPLQIQENDLGEIWYQIEYEGVVGFVRESAVDIIEIEDTSELLGEKSQEEDTQTMEAETETKIDTETKITEKETESEAVQETDTQEMQSMQPSDTVGKVTARKRVNPIDGIVIMLGAGSVVSAFLAMQVMKRMRKEQRIRADKKKNRRREG